MTKETVFPINKQAVSITPDPSLRHSVEKEEGQKVTLCYQCRKCSSGCPVSFAMDYLPDVVMRMVQLGLKEKVLNSNTIWVCASCETCTTRCPNEIDIAGVMDTLRRMALAEGKVAPAVRDVPKFHKAFLDSIKSGGRVHEIGMIAGYTLKAEPMAKLRSGELMEQAGLGWDMFKRGKLNIRPHKIRQTKEIKKLFTKKKK